MSKHKPEVLMSQLLSRPAFTMFNIRDFSSINIPNYMDSGIFKHKAKMHETVVGIFKIYPLKSEV